MASQLRALEGGRQGLRRRASAAGGFTLIELLVVTVILVILLGMMVTTLRKVRGAAKAFVCKNNLKTVAVDFAQFADGYAHPYRGDSDDGRSGFRIEDFQERMYRIAEFWDRHDVTQDDYSPARQPLMCPAGARTLQRRAGLPCQSYAVTPAENVSIGFNMRLNRASVVIRDRPVLKEVRLGEGILRSGSVPLAFDIDGRAAVRRSVLPYYSAPPAGDIGKYGDGLYWFPATTHDGRMNACFVGGHVLSSLSPEREPGWNWRYQPTPE